MGSQDGQLHKPLPRIGPDNEAFWEGCRRRELVLPFCADCGKAHLPPGPVCPHCFSDRLEWRKASGRGRISTWVVVHKAWFAAFAAEIPYNVVQVELDEGPRLTSSVKLAPHQALKIGDRVEVIFDDNDGDLPLPRFVIEGTRFAKRRKKPAAVAAGKARKKPSRPATAAARKARKKLSKPAASAARRTAGKPAARSTRRAVRGRGRSKR